MVGAILLILLFYVLSLPVLQRMQQRFPWFSLRLMKNLYWYHILLAVVYYVIAINSASDSFAYYQRPQEVYGGWFSVYGTGTTFIDFAGFPFINYLGFSYEMMMVLFAWLGYWGFVYFYIFFSENIQHKHYFYGMDLITLVIFLPNMHYWTTSLGKGSIIFWGLALCVYGLSRLGKRKMALLTGMAIVYHVRPHIFMVLCIGILLGLFTGRQKVPFYQKLLVLAGSAAALAFLYNDILAFVNLDSENLVESFDQFSSHRATELAKSTSGVDISQYPLVFKLFTFWFRPLFFDAPGPIGIIVSFENLFYILLAAQLFKSDIIRFFISSTALVKTSIIIFLCTSFALSGTLGNLGIIIRQKSMVMYFFLFVILAFLDYRKGLRLERQKTRLEQKVLRAVVT
jgi:hypothetical protein